MKRLASMSVIICLSQICNAESKNLNFFKLGVYTNGETTSKWDDVPRKGYGELTVNYISDKTEWCSVKWVGLEGWFNTAAKESQYEFDSWEATTGMVPVPDQCTCFDRGDSLDATVTDMIRTCKFTIGYEKDKDHRPDKVISFAGECIKSGSDRKGAYQLTTKFHLVTELEDTIRYVKLDGSLLLPALHGDISEKH